MATKPSIKPAWATNEGPTIVEPTTGAKASGWTAIKPPFQWMNWLHNLAYKWIDWFDQEDIANKARLTALESDLSTHKAKTMYFTKMLSYTTGASYNPCYITGFNQANCPFADIRAMSAMVTTASSSVALFDCESLIVPDSGSGHQLTIGNSTGSPATGDILRLQVIMA